MRDRRSHLRGALLLAGLVAVSVFAVDAPVSAQSQAELEAAAIAYQSAYEHDAPVRNFVYLYLRLAGIVWIAVEWVAAAVLVLAYRSLRAQFPPGEARP